ncbi:MAG TPA: acetate--CoA ligase family protein [Candidatus Nitrosocosmicus sp.]|nr:acetate--CoA ligase family protein [Candidatus Nitrosocosmicus sp.]
MYQNNVKSLFEDAFKNQTKVITEEMAKDILSSYDIKVPQFALVQNVDDAVREANSIGYPIVAKIVSPQILHKTDVGGVKVDLKNEADVISAFNDMYGRLAKQHDVKGILLEKMVPKGVEMIVGLQNDPQFGPVIMVGLGGIFTELFKDVSFRVLPITEKDALDMIEELQGKMLLKGYRGSFTINLDMLCKALVKIGNLGFDISPYYDSIDFNPVIVYSDSYYVADAKILLSNSPKYNAVSTAKPNSKYMDLFFNARSIALIGASPEVGKVGNSVLESLVKHDYKGNVFPVNAKGYSDIMGIKAYKSLDEISERVDVVVVTVDLKFVPELLKICGQKEIHNVVIISGGGKELGGERADIEQQIKDISSNLGIRVIGPNCIGMFNGENRLDCAFQGHERMLRPKNGNVSFLSQSGTVGIAFMEHSSPFGMSKMISYGNRSDVDEADMIWYLSEDPQTKVIGLYVEGLGDGRKFVDTARKVISERKKPIVVFKNGRTSRGAKQAASHTGSLGGTYNVVKGAFSQSGIISVDSYDELTASLKALSWQPIPKGNKVAMVTNGAGPIIAAIDQFEKLGLEVANLDEKSISSMKSHYPPTYVVGNPCDVTGSANASDYKFAIQTFMDDPNIDIVMPWFVFQDDPLEESIVEILSEFNKQRKKPILIGALGGPFTQKMANRLEENQIPVYQSVNSWTTAAGSLAKWAYLSQQNR